jgi:hypothetical protein
VGIDVTVNVGLVPDCEPTVTTNGPEVAPLGTIATIDVLVHVGAVSVVPLSVTVPGVEPKFTPVIVTCVPTIPELGEMLTIPGAVVTVKAAVLLDALPTVTTTFPVVAVDGTRA